MKRLVSILLMVSITFGAVSLRSKKSEAFIAGIMALTGGAAVPWLVIGGITESMGLSLFVLLSQKDGEDVSPTVVVASVAAVGLGLFFLADHSADVTFQKISVPQARKLKISPVDRTVYNLEVDELNAVRESAIRNFLKSRPHLKNEEQVLSFLSSEWKSAERESGLSPGTFRTAQAIIKNVEESI